MQVKIAPIPTLRRSTGFQPVAYLPDHGLEARATGSPNRSRSMNLTRADRALKTSSSSSTAKDLPNSTDHADHDDGPCVLSAGPSLRSRMTNDLPRDDQGEVIRRSHAQNRSAFTLVELLVVIGIIVIALALSVPAFSFLTGARSLEAGENAVAAMLGRARTEAINGNAYVGVFFFVDPKTDRTTLAIAELDPVDLDDPDPYDQYKAYSPAFSYTGRDTASAGPPPITADRVIHITRDNQVGGRPMVKVYRCTVTPTLGVSPPNGPMNPPFQNANWEEYVQGSLDYRRQDGVVVADNVTLPPGVAAQLIYDSGSTTTPDRYVRTGLIVFDPQGRLAGGRNFFVNKDSSLGRTLGSQIEHVAPNGNPDGKCKSSFGVVLYDRSTFLAQSASNGSLFTENDLHVTRRAHLGLDPTIFDEPAEETWLDENTTPLMVNRFSGALMSGGQ